MSDTRDQDNDRAALAAEHALRLADGEELSRARELEAGDSHFAADVARWRGRLAPLHAETEEVAPPASLWERIDSSLGRDGTAANDNVGVLKRRLTVWRTAAGAMTAVAASLAILLGFEPRQAPVPPSSTVARSGAAPMVAMLGDDKAMKVVASWDPSAQQLVLAVAGDMPADPRHAHELWVIPPGGKPRSLGTMADRKHMHMKLADTLATLLQQGATIAISVEPPGGSPTGAPTGPVVASGALTRA